MAGHAARRRCRTRSMPFGRGWILHALSNVGLRRAIVNCGKIRRPAVRAVRKGAESSLFYTGISLPRFCLSVGCPYFMEITFRLDSPDRAAASIRRRRKLHFVSVSAHWEMGSKGPRSFRLGNGENIFASSRTVSVSNGLLSYVQRFRLWGASAAPERRLDWVSDPHLR